MDFYDVNKYAGALVGAGIWAVVTGLTASYVFAPEKPAKPGFAVAIGGDGAAGNKAPAVVAPIEERLKTADLARGKKDFAKCAACHTGDKGGAVKVGPNLWGVVGGPKAHMAGFKYSAGMADRGRAGESWSFADLDRFLTEPKAFVPGTAMGFAGFKDAADRADVILYLRSLADQPVALSN
jgi:cytochrome c